jgi:hypothetical protein
VKPEKEIASRIKLLGDIAQFADVLESTDCVSDIFPEQPSLDHLHIIVERSDLADGKSLGSSDCIINLLTFARSASDQEKAFERS